MDLPAQNVRVVIPEIKKYFGELIPMIRRGKQCSQQNAFKLSEAFAVGKHS